MINSGKGVQTAGGGRRGLSSFTLKLLCCFTGHNRQFAGIVLTLKWLSRHSVSKHRLLLKILFAALPFLSSLLAFCLPAACLPLPITHIFQPGLATAREQSVFLLSLHRPQRAPRFAVLPAESRQLGIVLAFTPNNNKRKGLWLLPGESPEVHVPTLGGGKTSRFKVALSTPPCVTGGEAWGGAYWGGAQEGGLSDLGSHKRLGAQDMYLPCHRKELNRT